MYFDNRNADGGNRIRNGIRIVGVCPWINDDRSGVFACAVQGVDDLTFVIGLNHLNAHGKCLRFFSDLGVDLLECFASVNFGFSHTEQV